jgi:hypothetical protein
MLSYIDDCSYVNLDEVVFIEVEYLTEDDQWTLVIGFKSIPKPKTFGRWITKKAAVDTADVLWRVANDKGQEL